jgi:hypothetical protein
MAAVRNKASYLRRQLQYVTRGHQNRSGVIFNDFVEGIEMAREGLESPSYM